MKVTRLIFSAVLLGVITLPSSTLADDKTQIDRALEMAKALGPGTCSVLYEEDSYARAETIAHKFSVKYGKDDPSEYSLYRIPCWRAAYNEGVVFILFDENGDGELLSFALPDYEVEYENTDSDEVVKSIKITGYTSNTSVAYGDFNPISLEITWFNKSRGLGDAYTQGRWRFENRRFSLKSFDVDASYDGNSEAVNIVKFK